MANTLDSMDLKQIISLHRDGLSNRKISATLGIARNTVNGYIHAFAVAGANLVTGTAPLEVVFTGSGSTDDIGVVTYFWQFNDGSGVTATEPDPVHSFVTPGTY